MSKRKREDKGWNSLPWRPTEVSGAQQGWKVECSRREILPPVTFKKPGALGEMIMASQL